MRTTLLTLLALLLSLPLMAQRERNYVYVVDCTQSMQEPNKIWDITKKYLREDIERLSPQSTVSVVPFQGKAYEPISFVREEFNWNKIDKRLEELIKQKTNTGICRAWDGGVSLIDPAKDNYFYLLTDGQDNVDGMDAVVSRISQWCSKYDHSYGFYVMLCASAHNERLKEAAALCNRFSLIDANGHPSPIGTFHPREIRVNTNELVGVPLTFSDEGSYMVKIDCDDPLFTIELTNGIKNGRATVVVKPRLSMQEIRQSLGSETLYTFTADIIPQGNIKLDNPTLTIEVVNKPERSLAILGEEPDLGKTTHYPSFLFKSERMPDTLTADLKAVMNQEARQSGSRLRLRCNRIKGDDGYTLLYNGQPITGDVFEIDPSQSQSLLSLVFAPDAPSGKRNLELSVESATELDAINGQPANDYRLTMRASLSQRWNPLATLLFWLLIALAVALLAWLIVLRPMAYQQFRAKRLYIHEPTVKTIKLRGCRRVVFTSKPTKQSFINRLFTRRIEYVRDPAWTTEFSIVPNRRGARLQGLGTTYLTDPPTTQLQPGEECTIENSETKEKTIITLS